MNFCTGRTKKGDIFETKSLELLKKDLKKRSPEEVPNLKKWSKFSKNFKKCENSKHSKIVLIYSESLTEMVQICAKIVGFSAEKIQEKDCGRTCQPNTSW